MINPMLLDILFGWFLMYSNSENVGLLVVGLALTSRLLYHVGVLVIN